MMSAIKKPESEKDAGPRPAQDYSLTTLVACSPLGPCSIVNSTF